MKTAIILSADSPVLLHQAAEINVLLDRLTPGLPLAELWLICQGKPPDSIPKLHVPLSRLVLLGKDSRQSPESLLCLLEQAYHTAPMDLMLFGSDGLGAELATRLAYRLEGSSCLQVETCRIHPLEIEVVRPAYANNVCTALRLIRRPYCLSLAKKAAHSAETMARDHLPVEAALLKPLACPWVTTWSLVPDVPEKGLLTAKFVLAVGQGVGNRESMVRMEETAAALGAEPGASRPVVMNAWTGMNRLIGASGVIISPDVCIAAGVSGAGAFHVGIKDSRLIVAINTDSSAPVFRVADVGIVDDMFAVLDALKNLMAAAPPEEG